jgi:hypothetical protein
MPPIDVLVSMVVRGFVAPAATATAVLLIALWIGRNAPDFAGRAGGVLAMAAGFFAGYAALRPGPLWPHHTWHWLAYLPLAAGVACLVELLPGRWFLIGWLLRLAVAFGAAYLLIPAMEPAHSRWLTGMSAAIAGLWFVLDEWARRRPGPALPFFLITTVAAGSFVLFTSGNLKFAQLGGMMAAVLAIGMVVAWRRSSWPWIRGMVPGVAVLLPGLQAEGFLNNFSEVPATSFLLVVLAPLTSCLGLAAAMKSPWRQVWALALLLLPLGLAVVLAARAPVPEY